MMYRKEKNVKDILRILNNLRAEDLHEVKTLRGENFKRQIVKEIMESDGHFVMGVTDKGIPAVMGGVADAGSRSGCVWLLTTPEALNHRISLLKNLRQDILLFDNDFWLTYNILWEGNSIAKSWLKKLGYRFPRDKKTLNFHDRLILHYLPAPKGFEQFYRLKKIRGLK